MSEPLEVKILRKWLQSSPDEADVMRRLNAWSDDALRLVRRHFGIKDCPGVDQTGPCAYALERRREWKADPELAGMEFEDDCWCECQGSLKDQRLLPDMAQRELFVRVPPPPVEPEGPEIRSHPPKGYVREFIRTGNGEDVWTGRFIPDKRAPGKVTEYITERVFLRDGTEVEIKLPRIDGAISVYEEAGA